MIFRRLKELVFGLRTPFPYRNYNNRHRCIFIHIPKNAGTSILKSLGGNPSRRDHLDYLVYRKANRLKFESYLKFAVVRNPWDRLTSIYRYLKAGGNKKKDLYFLSFSDSHFQSFKHFTMDFLNHQRLHGFNLFRPQFSFVFDYADELQVDHILRFEAVGSDFKKLVAQELRINTDLPVSNRSTDRSDYRDYYDAELVERVRDLYSEDVSRFDYTFE